MHVPSSVLHLYYLFLASPCAIHLSGGGVVVPIGKGSVNYELSLGAARLRPLWPGDTGPPVCLLPFARPLAGSSIGGRRAHALCGPTGLPITPCGLGPPGGQTARWGEWYTAHCGQERYTARRCIWYR